VLPKRAMAEFAQMLSPFAPHLAEELWEKLGNSDTITYAAWPTFDEALTVDDEIEIVLQVKGKILDRVLVGKDADAATIEAIARANEKIAAAIEGQTIIKVIAVPGKLVNIVTK
jgi:leucyl-tRNA synthetase